MIIFDSFWVSQNGWDVISMRVACHDILDVVSPIYCILLYIVNVFIYLYLFILWWKHMYRFPLDQYNVIVIQPELCYAGIWWSLHCNPTWTVPAYDGHYIVIQPEPCRYMMIITLYSNPNLSYAGIWWSLHCNPTWTMLVYDGNYIVIQPEPCRCMMIITS